MPLRCAYVVGRNTVRQARNANSDSGFDDAVSAVAVTLVALAAGGMYGRRTVV